MKQALREKVWPVVAGVMAAFIVMMLFEYVNSHFYPLPADLDWKDPDAVDAFTETLPWMAYILVLLGWVKGPFTGGYLAARLGRGSKREVLYLALTVGGILTFVGLINNMMLGHSVLFNILTLPLFSISAYAGYRYRMHTPAPQPQHRPITPIIPRV